MKRRAIACVVLSMIGGASACSGEATPPPTPPTTSAAAPSAAAPSAAPTSAAPTSTAAPSAAATATSTASTAGPTTQPPAFRALNLPGAGADGVGMDYLACDRASGRVWVPAGNTGSVDVIDPNDKITRIEGFPTSEVERKGKKRVVGPSSASIGVGVVYIGNRADSNVCVVDMKALTRGACVKLESSPDGLAYVAATKELWVTTPRDKSLTIFDASSPAALKPKGKITLEGEPEGYSVDDAKGVFYTNLEDKDRTLAIDVRARKVVSTWKPGCGEDGPKGLAIDHSSGFLIVACSGRVEVLDTAHDGKQLSTLDTGEGVDNFEYLEPQRALYVAAGKAAKLTVARLDKAGALTASASIPTVPGARNAVVDKDGNAYLTDGKGGRILVVPAAR